MPKPDNAGASPAMAQYLAIKRDHPDALLFYRMGDFYELFFEDAKAAAAALDIALTKRGRHRGEDIPMCGVPVHSAEGYLHTLIRKGFHVAVCEQMEDPAEAKKRGAKAVVRREVVRLVTPGTLTEDALLEGRANNHLAAWVEIRGAGAIAWVDISTGLLTVTQCDRAALGPMLARLSPSELLIAEDGTAGEAGAEFTAAGGALTPLPRASFDSASAERRLRELFGVATLEGFGNFSRAELAALGAVIGYVEITQRGKLPAIRPPRREAPGAVMEIDAATRRNLELTRSLSGGREGSLLATIDRTLTSAGARLLATRLSSPSRDLATIRARHAAVAHFVEAPGTCERIGEMLRRVPDMERALTRLTLDRGGPRDLAAIRDGLGQGAAVAETLGGDLPELLQEAVAALRDHEAVVAALDAALVEEPPLNARDGGFVAEGHHAELDAARRLRDEGRAVIAELQTRYAQETGIPSLKIRHNNVLGYFVETTATHAKRMQAPPLSETFIHRQTTANQIRFTTLELSELETRILNAGGRALEIELAVFARLNEMIRIEAGRIAAAAAALAEIDLAASLADLALREDWTRPVVEEGGRFVIEEGRHPVVEQALARQGQGFVPNGCDLSSDGTRLWLVTGPNMAGKSTFLRQNALIAILAQAGSFVPAARAEIGLVTQLFSRVGAADDLARGRSTFMVEMVETAAILNRAGPGALVILDEIGRGTSTWDGLSIAWATLEHLHDVNRCRTLFATHYHELTALSSRLEAMTNATVSVREWQGEVVFLHEVRPGAADRSYGVQVARLAGLPEAVVARAREVLEALEKGEREGGRAAATLIDDLPLFAARPAEAPEPMRGPSPVERRLAEILPDTLSPRAALDLVYELKGMMLEAGGDREGK
ncbi:MAG: DNA mismatch repair protein MutS [Alphaproteobacteria bacterium]|nr:MAG: DNA mismatch repair protein MutS [Alphaproteobacteria bacterium]